MASKESPLPQTMGVAEAGKLFLGLGRNGSYAAVKKGELPVIRVGKRFRDPVRKMEAMLDAVPFKLTKVRA
jgi:hypothetical protein